MALSSVLQVLQDQNYGTTNALIIGLVVSIAVYWWINRRKYRLPPGPYGLPIVGYLPFLGKENHKLFERLGKKYGNVFGVYLGQKYMVVLGDYSIAKEALNMGPILGRLTAQFDFLPDGGGFSVTNSTEWSEQRRYTMRSMRDIGLGGSKWEALLEEEINDVMKSIEQNKGRPMNYCKILSESISNNVTMLAFGKRIPVNDPARQLVNEIVELAITASELTGLRNFFPTIADILMKFGIKEDFKDLDVKFREFSNYLRKQIEERKMLQKAEDSDTFVDGYLKEIELNVKNNLNNTFTERNLRGNVLALLAAASDATTAAITWLFIAMIMFPDVEEKVHQELHNVLGKDGRAKYTERAKLPYTTAVMQECMRWQTIAPLGVPRLVLEDTKIAGFDIPKDTLISPNIWAMHRDPTHWKEPEKFRPERFLTGDGQNLLSKVDGLMPFSVGKRNCPGETVARISMFVYFTSIMQKFKVQCPEGQTPNLEIKPGIANRVVDQELRFIPREDP